jgi:hypothetical protein
MMMFVAIGVIAGAILGLRFRMLILIPAVGVEFAAVLADGIAGGNGPWWIALAMIAVAASTQVGYFAGSVVSASIRARTATDGEVSMPRSAGMPGTV